jgi:hypothetical protein
MRSNLDRMKANLNLLMNVVIHRTQMVTAEWVTCSALQMSQTHTLNSRRRDEASIAPHLATIKDLMIEKEHYAQRYLAEKRKYHDLVERVNSTSTWGYLLVISAANGSRGIIKKAGQGRESIKNIAKEAGIALCVAFFSITTPL